MAAETDHVTDLITRPVVENSTVTLHGTVHPKTQTAIDLGELDPTASLNDLKLVLKPSDAQAAELNQFLEEQRDPASPNYQKWLTPEEFGARFGASENDLATLAAWLQSRGFTVKETAKAHNWITFSGTARVASAAFHTQIHVYRAGAETHYANAAEVSIPEALSAVVDTVRGLNDFHPAPPRTTRILPDYTSSNTAHYLAPDDLAAIYDIAPLYTAGYDGTVRIWRSRARPTSTSAISAPFAASSVCPRTIRKWFLLARTPGSVRAIRLKPIWISNGRARWRATRRSFM